MLMEGRTYIVGREGHIYINDPAVSKYHAEITIIDGEVYLKDLGSTNGTYLVKNRQLIYFKEGFVHLKQPVVLGNQKFTIENLLEIVGLFTLDQEKPEHPAVASEAALG